MRLLGLEVTRATPAVQKHFGTPVPSIWSRLITEPFTGAWQRNILPSQELILTYFAVYACITLIAGDISKMCISLMEEGADEIETEVPTSNPRTAFLRKPNRYQTRQQFIAWWITSKLIFGNTYVLKARDGRGIVTSGYILHPGFVTLLIAPDGSVFYQLAADNLSGITNGFIAPAREIMHDPMSPLYHPLCGVSPITACASAATQGMRIQSTSSQFFESGAQPSGVLTGPNPISNNAAQELEQRWAENFSGASNAGKVAVLGDGLQYAPMTMTARDAQLIDQLRWTAEVVCACFHVPLHKINVGQMPNYNNIEALDQQYYSQCLQTLIEALEAVLTEGLELPLGMAAECDLDDLLKMDTATKVKASVDGIKGGLFAPNEERKRFNRIPLPGGDTVYMQTQDTSIGALDRRDSAEPAPPAPALPEPMEADFAPFLKAFQDGLTV